MIEQMEKMSLKRRELEQNALQAQGKEADEIWARQQEEMERRQQNSEMQRKQAKIQIEEKRMEMRKRIREKIQSVIEMEEQKALKPAEE